MSESVWTQPHSTEDVGDFVAAIRRLEGRTQTELAADAGVPRRFVNELETGHATIYATRLVAVLRELGIRVRLEAGSQDPPTAHGAIRVTGRAQADVAPPEPEPLKDLGW